MVDLMRERQASMFGMFARMVLWTFAVSALIVQLVDDGARFPAGYAVSIVGLMGGLLFGVGAAVNGEGSLFGLFRLGHYKAGRTPHPPTERENSWEG